jgi:hypothetical protein
MDKQVESVVSRTAVGFICPLNLASNMRQLLVLLTVAMLALSVSAAGESGVNESTSTEGTQIAYINHASLVQEGGVFDMYVTVNSGSNVTSVQWITQICINTGVCYPPEINDMEAVDNDTYTATVDIDHTASYINWKYILHSEDDSQASVPESGFGWKVWSDCWYDNETWGGPSTDCQGVEGVGSLLPGFVAPAAAAAIGMAALMARRD